MKAFAYVHYLILATGRNKRFPFALLSDRGLVAYFADREAAEQFVLNR